MPSTNFNPRTNFNPGELSRFAQTLADTARTVIDNYYRQTLAIGSKGDESPVTIADRETERALRGLINKHYPQHGIFGEELGVENKNNQFVWVLDPIDGTRSFITGTPTFGTLIGLLVDGVPSLGIIDMPALDERWIGGVGLPSVQNSQTHAAQTCAVSSCEQLKNCRLACTSPDMFDAAALLQFNKLLAETSFYRYGGDCYNYALLASGYLDLVVEADLQPYDYCALVPVVENAGGCISDWQGKPLTLESDGRVVAAATTELHRQVIVKLNGQ